MARMNERCMDAGITDGCTVILEIASKETKTEKSSKTSSAEGASNNTEEQKEEFDQDVSGAFS